MNLVQVVEGTQECQFGPVLVEVSRIVHRRDGQGEVYARPLGSSSAFVSLPLDAFR
jgi:hypothetical protein